MPVSNNPIASPGWGTSPGSSPWWSPPAAAGSRNGSSIPYGGSQTVTDTGTSASNSGTYRDTYGEGLRQQLGGQLWHDYNAVGSPGAYNFNLDPNAYNAQFAPIGGTVGATRAYPEISQGGYMTPQQIAAGANAMKDEFRQTAASKMLDGSLGFSGRGFGMNSDALAEQNRRDNQIIMGKMPSAVEGYKAAQQKGNAELGLKQQQSAAQVAQAMGAEDVDRRKLQLSGANFLSSLNAQQNQIRQQQQSAALQGMLALQNPQPFSNSQSVSPHTQHFGNQFGALGSGGGGGASLGQIYGPETAAYNNMSGIWGPGTVGQSPFYTQSSNSGGYGGGSSAWADPYMSAYGGSSAWSNPSLGLMFGLDKMGGGGWDWSGDAGGGDFSG